MNSINKNICKVYKTVGVKVNIQNVLTQYIYKLTYIIQCLQIINLISSRILRYDLWSSIHHCVSARIRSYSGQCFLHSDWIRRNTPYLSIFSPNAGKCRPESFQIGTLSLQYNGPFKNKLKLIQCNPVLAMSDEIKRTSSKKLNHELDLKSFSLRQWITKTLTKLLTIRYPRMFLI